MIHYLHHGMHGSGFRIVGSINQKFDAGMYHGAGAHGARFNCSKQLTVSQTVVTQGCTGLAQGDDLGMSGGVGVCDVAVPSATNQLSMANDDGTYGNLSYFEGALGAAQGLFHPKFVIGGIVARRRSQVTSHPIAIVAAPCESVLRMQIAGTESDKE